MFSGIVEGTGTVVSAEPRGDVLRLRLEADFDLAGLGPGASVAVDGCCLTALEPSGRAFSCDLTRETLERTGFGERLAPGALVNLERPLPAHGRFDGHIVQGHVDGVGTVARMERRGDDVQLFVECPQEIASQLVDKGSVTIDGVSLTVVHAGETGFDVALIPHTLEVTTLSGCRPGRRVNLEVDILGKYVKTYLDRLLASRGLSASGAG